MAPKRKSEKTPKKKIAYGPSVKRYFRKIPQRINEALTGTAYGGPFTYHEGNRRPVSASDRLYREHDRRYMAYKKPYTRSNKADDDLVRGLSKVRKFSGVRDRIANKVAQVSLKAKSRFGKRELEPPPTSDRVKRTKYEFWMDSFKDAGDEHGESKRKEQDKDNMSSGDGTLRFGVSRRGRSRRAGRGTKKNKRKSKRNMKVTKKLVRQIERVQNSMQAPVRTLRSGYGEFISVNNSERWMFPYEFIMYDDADLDYLKLRAVSSATDYLGFYIDKTILVAEMTNAANHKCQVDVYRITARQKKSNAVNPRANVVAYCATDATDQPGSDGSTAFADQLVNFDMDQEVASGTTGDTTYFSGGADIIDTIMPSLNSFPTFKKAVVMTKWKTALLQPQDTLRCTMYGGKRFVKSGDVDSLDNSAPNVVPWVMYAVRVKTFPQPQTAPADSHVWGQPQVKLGCVWTKYANLKKVAKYGVVQRPIQYIVNSRTVETDFDVLSGLTAVGADQEA